MKQVTVMTQNKPGELAKITEILARKGINLAGLSQEVAADTAIIRLITKDYEKAAALLKGANYTVTLSDALVVALEDKPGQIEKIAQKLAMNKISVENIYHLHNRGNKVLVALKVDKYSEAKKVLQPLLATL